MWMEWIRSIGLVLLVLGVWSALALVAWSWCAAAGQADDDAERMFRLLEQEAVRRRELREREPDSSFTEFYPSAAERA